MEGSLRRLGTDRIDLLQMHEPDLETPLDDTLTALDTLVRSGKVREIGCSNFSAKLLEQAASISEERGLARFVAVQNQYSLLHQQPVESGVLDACRKLCVAFVPYFPLASGVLTGKYGDFNRPPPGTRMERLVVEDRREKASRFLNAKTMEVVDRLTAFAEAHGRTLVELALSWLVSQPEIASTVPGATTPSQARANAAAAGWKLSPEDLAELATLAPSSLRTLAVA